MSACRFQQRTECTGPGSMEFSLCQDCRGPVDLSKDGKREPQPTKPAAPETREEVKTMNTGRGVPAETGECPHCHKAGVKLKISDKFFGGGRGCALCYKRAQNAAARAKKTGQQGATKAHDVAKVKSAGASKAERPIAKPGPARDPLSGLRLDGKPEVVGPPVTIQIPNPSEINFAPLTARSLADALTAETIVLQVTCRTVAAILAVVRAAENDTDVMIAVGAKG